MLVSLARCLGFGQSCPTTAEGKPIFSNNFGTGTSNSNTATTDPYVIGHTYKAVTPPDGSYSVTTSSAQGTPPGASLPGEGVGFTKTAGTKELFYLG